MSFCSAQKILLPGQVLVSKSLLIKGECKHTKRQKESLVLTENEHQNSFAFLLCPLASGQLSVREPTMCLHIHPSEGLKQQERGSTWAACGWADSQKPTEWDLHPQRALEQHSQAVLYTQTQSCPSLSFPSPFASNRNFVLRFPPWQGKVCHTWCLQADLMSTHESQEGVCTVLEWCLSLQESHYHLHSWLPLAVLGP